MAKDCYIVNIYNSPQKSEQKDESKLITGIIEDTETGKKYTFHNIDELWGFMSGHHTKQQAIN